MEFKVETYAVLVAFLCNFFAIFLSNGIIVGVPSIASEFAMSNFIQNWIPTILFLVMAVFTVPAGQLSGKYGVKKSLLIGLIVYFIGSVGACVSFNSEMFLLFRIVQGAGIAFNGVCILLLTI